MEELNDSPAYARLADQLIERATKNQLADVARLLTLYALPAEHWLHLRTTDPIESTCATVRHRTRRTKNCVLRTTFLGLVALKLAAEAATSWRRIRAGGCSASCSPVRATGMGFR